MSGTGDPAPSRRTPDGSADGPELIRAVPLRHPGRWISSLVIVVLIFLFAYGVFTNNAYRWDLYRKYVFDQRVSQAALITIDLTLLSMLFGILIGIGLAVMRLSPNPVLKWVAWGYLWFFRGTPVYVQLVFWGLFTTIYKNVDLGIPFVHQFAHFNLINIQGLFWFAVIGLSLNEGAYMAEIVRAGISSVGEGQTEAAVALGMSWPLTMRRVVLPQAMRVIIPPTGNEVISMLKTTSLVVALPYSFDLYNRAHDIGVPIFQPVPLLLVASTWYIAITSVLMIGQYYLERYYSRGASRTLTARQMRALERAELALPGAGAGAR
ncbi:MAG TPA: amino acid ABC transporter permease [Jatrophihabitantaceae bacterium]|jgi:polar amino acid transport system permease protein|nr:amino acid ABC transporter permease [Jatrophihabitantaceae bacterium]